MINYKEISDNLQVNKIKELLIQLGAEDIVEKSTHLITNTICHNTNGGSLKLYYYFDTHLFMCYTSCEAQSIFKFLENYYKTRQYDYDWYQDIYLVALRCTNLSYLGGNTFKKPIDFINLRERFEKNRKEVNLTEYNENVLDAFIKDYYPIEWLSEGITKKAMDNFNIRFSISQNKIIIPHYNINNKLIGIRGRALNKDEIELYGKYTPVCVEQVMYSHPLSLNLYGFNKTVDAIKERGICYLFEAEKSVLFMEGFNMDNCAVAVCGSNFNIFQLKLLMKYAHPKEIVICFDNEEEPNSKKYLNKLCTIGTKYKNYCNFSIVYDKNGLLDKKDSPVDKGEEVFKALLSRRIKL